MDGMRWIPGTRLALMRYPMVGLLKRIWALRDNLSAYDASYVALAESLDCALVTADARLSNAPDLRCPITADSTLTPGFRSHS